MPFIKSVLLSLVALSLLGGGSSHAATTTRLALAPKDMEAARSALYFAERQRWDEALYHTRSTDPAIGKLIQWMLYRAKNNNVSFEKITKFITENPDWPDNALLRQRAEEAITLNTPHSLILAWFSSAPPVTADGIKFLAEAKAAKSSSSPKEQDSINSLIREAWVKGNFGKKDDIDFLNRHHQRLRTADHHARIDNLLWQGKVQQAQGLLYKADSMHQKLYTARIQLMENRGNIDSAVSNVPKALQANPGLLYERIVWNERKGNVSKVKELLQHMPDPPPFPEKWWNISNNYVRILLKERQYKAAYTIASKHGSEKGEDFAEAEWLSGWISLRFLNNPRTAYKHFFKLHQGTQYPISKARGAYWAGRASEKNNNQDIAVKWYQTASVYKDTFYGQLAILKLDRKRGLNLPATPIPTAQEQQSYARNELVKAAAFLIEAKQRDLAKKMLQRAVMNSKTPGEALLISEFGQSVQRFDLSVEASKQAARKGIIITKTSYPTLSGLPESKLEVPLWLAIVRQESSFDRNAQSPAGALGLMQLMPPTASMVAKELRMSYDKGQLTNQSYNLKLGSHYLQKLINTFDGSYIMAIASYNGGQGNVRKWQREYGDPRKAKSLDEIIDWIESIPFMETRNYVQRILENVQMYREILHKRPTTAPSIMLETDLKR